jgi:gentisate 1,2-dioxygenase
LILEVDAGTYTVVDGVELPMNENDVVLTPSWSWHGHGNRSADPAYWVDYLDVPLVHMLEPMFFEQYPDGFDEGSEVASHSPLLYAWSDVERRLAAAPRDPSGRTGRCVALDKYPLATIALAMIALDAGETTIPYRTTANNLYTVAQGRGHSVIGEREFSWQRGDVLVAPAWSSHFHHADDDAVLFRVSDDPVLAATGMLRTAD